MTVPNLADPDLRVGAVRRLLDRAEHGDVELGVLGGADLCVLGGPRHAVFPEATTQAWLGLGEQERSDAIDHVTARLVKDGQLIREPGTDGADYALSPELGVILGARCRPAFAVVSQAEGRAVPALSMFAVSDEGNPVRAIVAEFLAKPPDPATDRPAWPLACVYAYLLVSPSRAASLLAEWAITAPPKARRRAKEPVRVLTRFSPADDHDRIGLPMKVLGDGTRARVWTGDAERHCDRHELEAIMSGFLAGAPQRAVTPESLAPTPSPAVPALRPCCGGA